MKIHEVMCGKKKSLLEIKRKKKLPRLAYQVLGVGGKRISTYSRSPSSLCWNQDLFGLFRLSHSIQINQSSCHQLSCTWITGKNNHASLCKITRIFYILFRGGGGWGWGNACIRNTCGGHRTTWKSWFNLGISLGLYCMCVQVPEARKGCPIPSR